MKLTRRAFGRFLFGLPAVAVAGVAVAKALPSRMYVYHKSAVVVRYGGPAGGGMTSIEDAYIRSYEAEVHAIFKRKAAAFKARG